ncbi:unnamed protein product [Camellia sinensis]
MKLKFKVACMRSVIQPSIVIRRMTKRRTSAWTLSCQPTYVPPVEIPDMSNGQSHVI